ncbi:MAG: C4-dicarboxylate ABC transporter substrate-binding protein, partial [Pseudomonadota bacterium]
GLDHTLIVCYLTKKFEVAKNFTPVNYAQGLFIWVFNKAWFKSLPADLQATFKKVVNEQCAIYRGQCKTQEEEAPTGAGEKEKVKFWELSKADLATLQKEGDTVHQEYAKEIGPEYLKEVQTLLGYTK